MRTKTLLVILFGLTCTRLVQAQHTTQQLVTLHVENEPLKTVLHMIEKQAAVKFMYTNQINKNQKTSLFVTDVPLAEVLTILFEPLTIDYQWMDNGFIILKKNKDFLPGGDGLHREETHKEKKALSQQITVCGKITDARTNKAIASVHIQVKGTSLGVISDAEGQYSIQADTGSTLVFSYVGYLPKIIQVGVLTQINVSLSVDIHPLDEVVVTALGLEREKRMVGYAMQVVPGENIQTGRESNLVSMLAGKLAGVTVLNNPSGIGGSSRITIRGERSLNINKNQPLFVVDGLPVTNELIGSSGRNNQEVDYGNGAGLINPDDVESITVLKGANATALYGSRGQNGVVLVETKTGKAGKGLEVSLSSTITLENPLRLPEYQNTYGQGVNGTFEFKEDLGSINWGPAMDGQLIKQFDSPTTNGLGGRCWKPACTDRDN